MQLAVATACAVAMSLLTSVATGAKQVEGQTLVVTRNGLSLPAGCGPLEIGGVMQAFFSALASDNASAVRESFVQNDPPGRPLEPAGRAFRWYSVTEVRRNGSNISHFVAYDLSDLFEYFAARHRHNERMELIAAEIGLTSVSGAAGVTFVVRRDADDLVKGLGGRQRLAYGKAGIDCQNRQIYQWSMGMEIGSGPNLIHRVVTCPVPGGWKPGTPGIVCTRGPNAPTFSPGFRVRHTESSPLKACASSHVITRLHSTLAAFNAGDGGSFARSFTSNGDLRFSTALMRRRRVVGRGAISRLVPTLYRSGEGWTAIELALNPKAVKTRSHAAYSLSLNLTYQTVKRGTGQVLLQVDCRSGLFQEWIGPRRSMP